MGMYDITSVYQAAEKTLVCRVFKVVNVTKTNPDITRFLDLINPPQNGPSVRGESHHLPQQITEKKVTSPIVMVVDL
jgi:hypothetical protein